MKKLERARQTTKALYELTESYIELHEAIKSTAKEAVKTKKLWREGNKSKLIKIGIACIMFPDPVPVSDVIGAGFLLAGAIQKGIQNRAIYVGDVNKNLLRTLNELNAIQRSL